MKINVRYFCICFLLLIPLSCASSRRNTYVQANPKSSYITEIQQGQISLGMSMAEVEATGGPPTRIRISKISTGADHSMWVMEPNWILGRNNTTYIFFKNGFVTGWKQ